MSEQKFERFQQVLVKDNVGDEWNLSLYSHYCKGMFTPHICINGTPWRYCLPYKGNERLVGTCESPEEKEKFEFGDKVRVNDIKNTPYREGIFIEYSDDHSGYVVLSKFSHTIDEWNYCKKGWDGEDE